MIFVYICWYWFIFVHFYSYVVDICWYLLIFVYSLLISIHGICLYLFICGDMSSLFVHFYSYLIICGAYLLIVVGIYFLFVDIWLYWYLLIVSICCSYLLLFVYISSYLLMFYLYVLIFIDMSASQSAALQRSRPWSCAARRDRICQQLIFSFIEMVCKRDLQLDLSKSIYKYTSTNCLHL